jgi:hypothetical protein
MEDDVKQKILRNSCTARTQLTDLQGCEGTAVVDGHAASTVSETEVRTNKDTKTQYKTKHSRVVPIVTEEEERRTQEESGDAPLLRP